MAGCIILFRKAGEALPSRRRWFAGRVVQTAGTRWSDFALRSQFRYAVRHQRQAASGAEALRSLVKELRRLCEIFSQPSVTLDNAIRAGQSIEQHVCELEALVAAAESTDVGSKQTVFGRRKEAEK